MLRHGRYSCERQPNSTLALPFPVASGLAAAVDNIFSLEKSRLATTPRFLQTNDVAAHFLVHVEDLRRSSHAVLPIHSHRPHVMGSDDEFPSASSVTVVARLSSCRATSRSPSPPLFSAHTFFLLITFCTKTSVLQFLPPFAPEFLVSRGGFGSLPCVGSPIFHARAESGAYSRAPLLLPAFRDGAAAVCFPLPLVRTVWLVGLAEVAPPTPSNALLADQIRSHELRSTSACSPSRSLTLSSLPQGLVLPRPGSSRGRGMGQE